MRTILFSLCLSILALGPVAHASTTRAPAKDTSATATPTSTRTRIGSRASRARASRTGVARQTVTLRGTPTGSKRQQRVGLIEALARAAVQIGVNAAVDGAIREVAGPEVADARLRTQFVGDAVEMVAGEEAGDRAAAAQGLVETIAGGPRGFVGQVLGRRGR